MSLTADFADDKLKLSICKECSIIQAYGLALEFGI